MADLDDEAITVTLPPEDTGGAVITEVEKKAEPKPPADDPISDLKGQFETLKGTLNQTTQRLVGAERELETTRQQLETSKKEVTTSQLDTVLSGIQAAESDANAAEREYIAAAEAGDFAAQARAQRKISGAEARIQRLKEAEADLKDTTAKPVIKQEPRQQQPSTDPVDRFTAGMAPRAAAWIRAHPDYVTNDGKNKDMLLCHHRALADGLVEGGDEYFARLDEMATPKAKVESKPEPKVNIRPSAPVAPSGGTGGANGSGQSVTLTRREVEAANDGTHLWERDSPDGKHKRGSPLGVQEFARRKSIMMRQGLYDRTFNEQ